MPMFLKLSDQISECLGYAVDARERADAAADPSCKLADGGNSMSAIGN